MHESLLALPDTLDNLKNEIAKLCETWFNKGFPNKDKLNANVLIYLLRKTVLPSGIVSTKIYHFERSLQEYLLYEHFNLWFTTVAYKRDARATRANED